MKELLFIKTHNNLDLHSLHIKLDGTVATIGRRKASLGTRMMKTVQSVISFITAPIP